ncbi:MAG: HmuY family protein [Porphyromonadaceae bacterium]|nr:HmuY family protein [Porphyromonadaceae bacterium]
MTGSIIGRSKLGDATEDSLWYNRTDWDIALCSDMLRTNSGTSGVGKGGIQTVVTRNFEAITTAPEEGYLIDNNDVILKR